MAMVELFRTTVRMGMPERTAVSKSRPVIPNAASPMKLTTNLSGAASLAPMLSPSPGAQAVRLPPADVGVRAARLVERHKLVTRAAGVMCHDSVIWVHVSA